MRPKRTSRPDRPAGIVRERDILVLVRDYLTARGYVLFRRNVGAVQSGTRYIRYSQPGQADLYGWHRDTGKHIEIEVKAPGKEPTAQQYAWLRYVRDTGAIAVWCDSLERLQMQLGPAILPS